MRFPVRTTDVTARAWQPLLGVPARQRVEGAISDVAAALAGRTDDQSLAGGKAGMALFFAHRAQMTGCEADAQQALHLVEEAIIASWREANPSLFTGVTGAAWVLTEVERALGVDIGADVGDSVDAALLEVLGEAPWPHEYDLISGLVGMGVYALGAMPRPGAADCLVRVLDRLGEMAEHRHDGITWLTRPELLPELQSALAPMGYYDLGVAHGVPAVIALLTSASAAGMATAETDRLIEGAAAWLLAQRSPPGRSSTFPVWVGPGINGRPARSAWCYGDPGVAATLLVAARATGKEEWETEAVDIALRAARRPVEDTEVEDAGICHGAAGLAHIYNRLWQATGVRAFGAAAETWVERTVDLLPQLTERGFLNGAAGVGLVLLAALGAYPSWDSALLLSSPAGRGSGRIDA